ncbi:MAG TPA: M56 family metallopeptidase [Vicinamibacterales bacterium]|nr:M56 family metallopeptidase [Vicinamibacterales bacterium]
MAFWPLLVDVIVKASFVVGLAAIAAALLRRAPASLRHLVWTLGLAGALLVPALSLALPRWELPLTTLAAPETASSTGGFATLPPPGAAASAVVQPRLARGAGDEVTPSPNPIDRAAAAPPAWPFDRFTTIVLVWALGALLILARLVAGLLAVGWLSRRMPEADGPWLALAQRLAADIGITSRLRFLRGAPASMPMACGVLRPAVLMPEDADGWPDARLRIVLLHELAHVKRRDCLTHVFAQIACAVHWFNPLVWIAARRMRAERERACDDLVLAAGTRGSDYADQLIEIARVMRIGRFPALWTGTTLAMAHRTQLEGRLLAILDPGIPRHTLTRVRIAAAACVFAAVLVPVATVQPWAETVHAQEAPEPSPVTRPAPVPAAAAAPHPSRHQQRPAAQPQPAPDAPPHADQDLDIDASISGAIDAAVAQGVQAATSAALANDVQQAVSAAIAEGVTRGTSGLAATLTPAIVGQVAEFSRHHGQPLDSKTLAALTDALNDANAAVREMALGALARMRDPRTFDALISALKDADADAREKAVFGLGQLRDRRAVAALTRMLRDTSADVREQAAFALGQVRDPAALDALTAALRDASPDVREQAAFALGQIRDPRAVDALISALKDRASDVREQAAFALGRIRDARAIDALTAALRDANESVREQAAFALGQIAR